MSEDAALEVHQDDSGVRVSVRVLPRASRSAVMGVHDRALKVSLAAPPVEGEANAALCELFAKTFSVPKRSVRILHGERGKQKVVHIAGITADAVHALLADGAHTPHAAPGKHAKRGKRDAHKPKDP